jgi:transposase
MHNQEDIVNRIQTKYDALKNHLDERSRRLWGATEANALGHGGVKWVAKATGMAESTIRIGRRELRPSQPEEPDDRRVRRSGGGRKRLIAKDPHLLHALDALVEPTSRGDPTSPLRWTCKSTRKLEAQLQLQGFKISHTKVGQLLNGLGYSLQSPRKRYEGASHPDRNAQFVYINSLVKAFQGRGQPVISVDAKKKELIGNFANGGQEYHPKGTPHEVEAYDFPSLAEG